jgi:hypothetical protein
LDEQQAIVLADMHLGRMCCGKPSHLYQDLPHDLLSMLCCRMLLHAAPAFVYGCHWSVVPAYIFAELLGGIAAALISWPLYGTGLELGR